MTVLLSLLSVSSRFACSGHSLRTRRRGDARATTGCKKKSSNLYTRRTILYIVPDLSISVQFRVCRHQPEFRVSPTLLPGQSQLEVTTEGRRVTRLQTWPAWAARPARASRPGALRRVWSAGTTLSAVPDGKCAPHVSFKITGIFTLNSANKY